jgi:hypothetical protein
VSPVELTDERGRGKKEPKHSILPVKRDQTEVKRSAGHVVFVLSIFSGGYWLVYVSSQIDYCVHK